MSKTPKIGYCLPTIIVNLLLLHHNDKFNYEESVEFSKKVDDFIMENIPDWLSFYNGLTYDLTFIPKNRD